MGMRRSTSLRIGAAAIAAVVVAAGLAGIAVEAGSDDGVPAPIVWRDYVLDPTTTSTP